MMMDLMAFFSAAVVIAAVLAFIAIAAPRHVAVKVVAFVCAVLLMPTAYASFVELMGRPKPQQLEWFRDLGADPHVVGSQIREGEAIYLWLQFDAAEPVAYKLPWDQRTARQLHETRRQTGEAGRKMRFRWQSRNGVEDEREELFYAEPQPPLPAKYRQVTR